MLSGMTTRIGVVGPTLIVAIAAADPPFFTAINEAPGGWGRGDAWGLSADGSTVVGEFYLPGSPNSEGFRWTAAGGLEPLGFLPGADPVIRISPAFGASADGSVVVGRCYMPSEDYAAYRWTSAGGMVNLGDLPGGYVASQATATSADGAVVVGVSRSASGIEAFRWIEGRGMEGIGALPGPEFRSFARAVSADGEVVAGYSEPIISAERPFRWTQATGMQDLGTLPGGSRAWANDISADGATIVGRSSHAGAGWRAFRWTEATGLQDLGLLAGATTSEASGVSADGSVIVGSSFAAGGPWRSFLWTEVSGMVDLRQRLLALGLTQVDDWELLANAVSDDGRIIAGTGVAPGGREEAWIASLGDACPADCDGDTELTFFDFLCFQNLFAAGDLRADCDGDGTLTFFDFLCFQNAFAAGCS